MALRRLAAFCIYNEELTTVRVDERIAFQNFRIGHKDSEEIEEIEPRVFSVLIPDDIHVRNHASYLYRNSTYEDGQLTLPCEGKEVFAK